MSGINQSSVVTLGTASVVLGSLDAGLIAKDIKVTIKNAKVDLTAALTGKAPLQSYLSTATAEIDFTLAQTDFDIISGFFPQTSLLSSASGNAITFGNFSGERQVPQSLTIIPLTGPFANYSLSVDAVVPIGSPTITYDPSKGAEWAVKLNVIANATALDGNVLGLKFGKLTTVATGGFAVSTVSPSNGASGVPVTGTYTVTFTNPINNLTFTSSTFLLASGTGAGTTQVAGSITFPTTSGARFTPSSNLTSGSTYYGVVDSSVKDVYGNSLASFYHSTFTT